MLLAHNELLYCTSFLLQQKSSIARASLELTLILVKLSHPTLVSFSFKLLLKLKIVCSVVDAVRLSKS